MKIKQTIQKLVLFLKTNTGRLWIKRAILFIIFLLGLKWAIATGVREGTSQGLWDIEKELQYIGGEISELNQTLLFNSATSQR